MKVSVPGSDLLGSALRRLNVAFYRRLAPEQKQRVIRHPEFGEISVEWVIRVVAGHDLHHLQHREAIARQ